MIIESFKKCTSCGTILYYDEATCPMCDGVTFQDTVYDTEFLEFLVGLDELPKESTVDDIRPYCMKVIANDY